MKPKEQNLKNNELKYSLQWFSREETNLLKGDTFLKTGNFIQYHHCQLWMENSILKKFIQLKHITEIQFIYTYKYIYNFV